MTPRARFVIVLAVLAVVAGVVAASAFFAGSQTATESVPEPEVINQAAVSNEAATESPQQSQDDREALFDPPERLGVMIASTISKSVQIECQDGYGTGWIYDTPYTPTYRNEEVELAAQGKDMLVITAKHVIDDCKQDPSNIKVMIEFEEIPSQLLNWHNKTDLATIAVSANNPGLQGSDEVKQGMWAMAVGWPFNYNLSPTIGRVIEIEDTELYIDVLIEPGNSGGPLVDSSGAVIGTVTAGFLDDNDVSTGFNIATKTRALCAKLLTCRD